MTLSMMPWGMRMMKTRGEGLSFHICVLNGNSKYAHFTRSRTINYYKQVLTKGMIESTTVFFLSLIFSADFSSSLSKKKK